MWMKVFWRFQPIKPIKTQQKALKPVSQSVNKNFQLQKKNKNLFFPVFLNPKLFNAKYLMDILHLGQRLEFQVIRMHSDVIY